jgi:hypothetical protein
MSVMTTPSFFKRFLGPTKSFELDAPALTLRYATPSDVDAIDRVAQLDSQRAPRGVVLVAEVGDDLWAAISLDDHHAVADPFRPAGELVALLHERARQLRRKRHSGAPDLPRVWPATGYDSAALS